MVEKENEYHRTYTDRAVVQEELLAKFKWFAYTGLLLASNDPPMMP